MSFCPGDERLVQLLEEQLDRRELVDIEQHLEHCDQCQETLEGLTRDRFSFSGWRPWSDVNHAPDASFDGSGSAFDREGEDEGRRRGRSRQRPVGPPTVEHPPTLHSGFDWGSGGDETPEVEGYEILGRLGQGGMGVVYRARQHGLERLVALKMIRGGPHAAPEHLARFKIEARSVARLRHPNVVQIFDVGQAGGLPFVALELLEGGSLESRVDGTPQPERSSAELLLTLAGAIASAHRAGVVHRDLKSANILFATDGTPKIADFGLAKRLDEEDGQTHSGQVMGSPSFMSPEQARGKGREVGPASDLYSLGAILYEMIAGRPPFKGPSAMDTLLQVVNDEPIPPSRLRPGLSRDLETICLKCLAKDPGRRYGSAEALADDLRRYLAGSPIRARRVGLRERAWKWARRQPAAASLVLVAIVASVALAAFGVRSYKQVLAFRADADKYRFKANRMLSQADVALGNGEWEPVLERLRPLLAEGAYNPMVGEIRNEVREMVARLEKARKARLEVDDARAKLLSFRQLRRRAQLVDAQIVGAVDLGDVEAIRKAAVEALEVFRDGTPDALAAQKQEVEQGRHELTLIRAEAVSRPAPGEDPRQQAKLALAILDQETGPHTTTRADHLLRAEFLAKLGDASGAEAERKAVEAVPTTDAFGHVLKGQSLYRRRRWDEAIAEFEKALGDEPDQFRAQLLLAVCQLQVQKFEAAKACLTAALQREPKAMGLYLLRGFAYGEEGSQRSRRARSRPELKADAEAQFEAAEADYRTAEALGHLPSEKYGLYVNRGTLRFRRDRLDAAVTDLLQAIELRPDQVTAIVTLGHVYSRQGRSVEAIDQFTEAIRLRPEIAALYRSRALARIDRGKPTAEARELAILDLSEAIRLEPSGSKDAAVDLARRARLHLIAGRAVVALQDCEAALRADPNEPEALVGRVKALQDLKRFEEVIVACNEALTRAKPSADLFELRGLARSSRQEYSGAIQDYTQALSLDPSRLVPRIQRGWAYLISDAPKLALDDFDQAVRVAPEEPDAYNGRGLARAILGQHQLAVSDAEESLRHGPSDPRTPYNAARVYARAAASVVADAPRKNLGQVQVANGYLDKAQFLLRQALERLPADQRGPFWDDVIQADPALAAIRQRPKFSQLAGQFGRQAK